MRSEALIAKIYFTKIPSSARVLESLPLSADCYFWRLTLSSMKLNFSIQGFLYWEDGGESPTSTTSWKFVHSPQPGKMPRTKFLSPQLNDNFHVITLQKINQWKNHPMKKFLLLPKFPPPSPTGRRDLSPTSLMLFEKPWHVSFFHHKV